MLKVKGFSEVKVEKIKEAVQKLQVGCHVLARDPKPGAGLLKQQFLAFDVGLYHRYRVGPPEEAGYQNIHW